jgi:para-aminobenzoate synthetase/4-amino-4-deoxychorismate lyase
MIPTLPEGATADFALLETMKVSADGTIHLLSRHLERLGGSARYFGFACDLEGLHQDVMTEAARQREPAMLRLLLFRDGTYELQVKPLPRAGRPSVLRLCPSLITVDRSSPFLYHKTTVRGIYEQARTGCDEETDVILTNERGEVTETTIANIAVLRKDRWVTPMVSCGLLAGTMRAQLLDEGQLVEGIVRLEELLPGETIRCFNAVRGVFEVTFGERSGPETGI